MTTETIDWDSLEAIKAAKPRRVTMLDILGVSTKEVNITKAYAYFLNSSSDSNLHKRFASIVFSAFGQNITEWPDYRVLTEATVFYDRTYRIDLLIISGHKALILENKIYAGLYNSLEKYRRAVAWTFRVNVEDSKFLCVSGRSDGISHQKICQEMKEQLKIAIDRGEDYFQFKEFIDHMIKISDVSGDIHDFTDYTAKASAITNAIALKERAYQYFSNFIVGVAESLIQSAYPELSHDQFGAYYLEKKGCWIHVYPKLIANKEIYLTIAYEEFLKQGNAKPIYVIVESSKDKSDSVKKYFNEKFPQKIQKELRSGGEWAHCYVEEVKFLNDSGNGESFNERLLNTALGMFEKIKGFNTIQN